MKTLLAANSYGLLQYLVMHKHDRTQTAAVTVLKAKRYTVQQLYLCIKEHSSIPGNCKGIFYSTTDITLV